MGSLEQEFVKEAFDTNWIAPVGPHVDALLCLQEVNLALLNPSRKKIS